MCFSKLLKYWPTFKYVKLILNKFLDGVKKLVGNSFEPEERLELRGSDGQGGGGSEGADHRKRDEVDQDAQIQ